MIAAQQVVFDYPGKQVLKNVTFSLAQGSITALVGPNGVGKTTLMRCIAALEEPLSGDIWVNGLSVRDKPRVVHRQVGYLSDFFGLYDDLTVEQCLVFAAQSRPISREDVQEHVDSISTKLNLTRVLNKKAGVLSRGWRQRLGIAQAMIHQPNVLLLDEPASGLDPKTRWDLSELFLQLKAQGTTLMISSHILAELEDYCTDMLMICDGRVIEHVSTDKSVNQQVHSNLIDIVLCEEISIYRAQFEAIPGVSLVSMSDKHIRLKFSGDDVAVHQLLSQLLQAQIPICGFSVKERRLQDVYMSHIERG